MTLRRLAGNAWKMKTIFNNEAQIIRIGEGLAACSLPRAEWTHGAHFAAALWLMRYRPDLDAARAMPGLIRAYNESVGRVNDDSGGYHESITRLYVYGIAAFRLRQPAASFEDGLESLLNSPMSSSSWPLQFYSRERLFCVEARRCWVEPDLPSSG